MHSHTDLIHTFYSCFQKRDSQGMAHCYHRDITFSDPVFTHLTGTMAENMWHMLCSQARGFELTFTDIQANETTGSVHWEARYLFSKSGRRVHNKIDASFQFRDGKIIRHTDHFNFWKWSTMALGPMGYFLGWSPFLKHKVQESAAENLNNFELKKNK